MKLSLEDTMDKLVKDLADIHRPFTQTTSAIVCEDMVSERSEKIYLI